MASVTFPVITASPVLELVTASVLTLGVSPSTVIFQSSTGRPIVAGTAYLQLNSGTVPQWRRRVLSSDPGEIAGRRLLQTGLPLVTGDCNGDGLFNANDATYAQNLVTSGVSSWPTSSISQMRNCAPTYSYMFNAIRSAYTASQIQITIADVAYLLSASTNKLFFMNISSPYDLVTTVPRADNSAWAATATFYYYPSSTAVAAYSAAPCASVSGYFEMNLASMPYSISVGSRYGNTTRGVVFQGACTSGTFVVNIITNWQNTLNMSVGFINSATSDPYAFFGMDVGAFINANTNFVNVLGSTIVSGPIYTSAITLVSSTATPISTTTFPTTTPSTKTPSSNSPSSSQPSSVFPSVSPVTKSPSASPVISSTSTSIPTTFPSTLAPVFPSVLPVTKSPSASPVTSSTSTSIPTTFPSTLAPSVSPTVDVI
jgi:hypothetical protein